MDNYWIRPDNDFHTWEFRPSLWQRIKLLFGPVYVGVDLADDLEVTVKSQRINGQIIITEISERKS